MLILIAGVALSSCSGVSSSNESATSGVIKGFAIQLFSGFGELMHVVTPPKNGAEGAVENFVLSMASGNCENAMKNATGRAIDLVQASMDAGCQSYSTEIKSITCEGEKNSATCTCQEKRDGLEMTFIYQLENIDKKWKVENYEKDLNY